MAVAFSGVGPSQHNPNSYHTLEQAKSKIVENSWLSSQTDSSKNTLSFLMKDFWDGQFPFPKLLDPQFSHFYSKDLP